jgi:hypothetical protein
LMMMDGDGSLYEEFGEIWGCVTSKQRELNIAWMYVMEWCIEMEAELERIVRLEVGFTTRHGRLKCSNFLHLTS